MNMQGNMTVPAARFGIGGPVGSGKTALVERLISENPEDLLSEPPVSTGPKSVKETRQKKKPSKDQGKRRQQVWIKTQYGRLLQSLFQSSIFGPRLAEWLIIL